MRRDRVKLFFATLGGYVASVLPLVCLFAAKWETYTGASRGAFRLCLGGGIVLILLLFKVLGKLRMPSRALGMILCLILSYLLEAVLSDLTLILWMALLGELVDALFFARAVRLLRERLQADRVADAAAERLKRYFEDGRKRE